MISAGPIGFLPVEGLPSPTVTMEILAPASPDLANFSNFRASSRSGQDPVHLRQLLFRELPAGRSDVVPDLLRRGSAGDDGGDGRAGEQPGERQLQDRVPAGLGKSDQRL